VPLVVLVQTTITSRGAVLKKKCGKGTHPKNRAAEPELGILAGDGAQIKNQEP